MGSPPEPDLLDERQQRAAVVGQRVLDGRRERALRLAVNNAVGDQLAELLREDFR